MLSTTKTCFQLVKKKRREVIPRSKNPPKTDRFGRWMCEKSVPNGKKPLEITLRKSTQ